MEGTLAMAALLLWGAGAAPADPRAYGGPTEVADEADEADEGDRASAESPRVAPEEPAPEPTARRGEPLDADGGMARDVVVEPRSPPQAEPDRASSVVTRREIEERLPRSAPDAVRYEPGVYVQQTAHSQASPFVRGLTGQQTLIMFDGIRLNTSTFRQGPNQYFFTVDSRTIQTLEVIRGSASTKYGSDALGGALLAEPIEPSLDTGKRAVVAHPRLMFRAGSADSELGGRAQLDLSYKGKLGVFGGIGYRSVGELESGGKIREPATGEVQKVPPKFADDGRTQRGTGFDELTADVRAVWQANEKHRVTLGYYDYRQLDAPRTDKCPAPTTNEEFCLEYLEQFRTLVYGAYDATRGPAAAETVRWTVSFQNQHELRREDRGSLEPSDENGLDDVNTVGTGLQLRTRTFTLAPWADLRVLYGTDAYLDWISSEAWLFYDDVDLISFRPRGQYLDGAKYLTSGLWTEVQVELWKILGLRAGGRGALAYANADGETESSSLPVDEHWLTAVGNVGARVKALPWLAFMVNADQGFRAPNLDDLTSRQQTGQGFQFENAELDPERSLTLEGGVAIRHPVVEVSAWVFQNWLHDKIERARRTPEECPPGDDACTASQFRSQLVNLDDVAVIRGAEGGVRLFLPWDLHARATIAYAWGEGPNPNAPGEDMPLSRIPPLNGTAEAGWRSTDLGLYATAAVRWATLQDRLSDGDVDDARIPRGGTPGFAAVDLRAGLRLDPHVLMGIVLENIGDAAYRYHGSSVNGPGRSAILNVEVGW